MKKNIKEDVPGLEFINQLRPVTYTLDVNGIRTFLEEDKTFGDKSIENMRSIDKNFEITTNNNWNNDSKII